MSLEPQLEGSKPSTSMGSRSVSPPPSPAASTSSPPPTTSAASASTSTSKKMQAVTATSAPSGSSAMNAWPTFASPADPNSLHHHPHHHPQQHRYTYGFGVGVPSHLRIDTSSPAQRMNGLYSPFDTSVHGHGHPPQLPLPYPHAHSESSLRQRPSSVHSQSSPTSATHGYMLPPLPESHYSPIDTLLQQSQSRPQHQQHQHPGITSTTSAPSVLLQQRTTSGSKRSLDVDTSSSSASAKRQRRPSTTPSNNSDSVSTPTETGNGQRQALLSPSQKRANHIQSEQKRRANIRRGYEALCEVVPSLREAIRAEEEGGAAAGECLDLRLTFARRSEGIPCSPSLWRG